MRHHAFPDGVTRESLIEWYRATRARTRQLFELITPDAYYDRPIALRNPIVFYEGHLPAFSVNTLVKLTLNREGIDEHLETIFERGIDPDSEVAVRSPTDVWPSRGEVQAYGTQADALVERTLGEDNIEIDGGEAVFTIIEHELMHQETLLYMFHQLPYSKKRGGQAVPPVTGLRTGRISGPPRIRIPGGRATLGAPRDAAFGWDNEFPELAVDVDAFEIDVHNVTNGDYLEYVEATGANAPHFWIAVDGAWHRRGLLELAPLPLNAPVYVTHEEASAYARWKGARLPTEAEYHRAAYGSPAGEEHAHPWGDDAPDVTRGNFDFQSWDPIDVGSYSPSAWGVHDLAGNGWEWTSTPFAGFPGFTPMPSYRVYSADFFDDAHFVMKGASPITPRELIRRSFRNWFRPNYPYVHATFRCAR
jgi:iron(II)-dependent oxidoreductase